MTFKLIQIKFDIDINNDELLIIVWEHNTRENFHWWCVAMWSPSCSWLKMKIATTFCWCLIILKWTKNGK
jgi:hypothetical protein